jgi:hypothetical protein
VTDALEPPELYPFKLRHGRTGRWYRARWHASLDEIERLGGEVCGAGVAYRALGNTSMFLRGSPSVPPAPLQMDPHRAVPPGIDALERSLLRTFLRRYATWCLRKRSFAAAQGASALYRDLI